MPSPILTIDQLIIPLTPLQVKTKIYEILAQLQVSTSNWKPGGVTRLIVSACSIVLAAFSVFISLIARAGFLTLSSGDWLTLVAQFVYGVQRGAASFASGTITLTNSQGGSFTPAADDIVFSNPATGKTYRNTSPFTLNANSSVTVAIRADEAGAASSTGPGTITTMVTTLTGVTCSNVGSLIGADQQTDDSLIAECLLKPKSLSPNGPREAYKLFALQALRSDGTPVGVNRVSVSNSSTTGQSVVTVANPSGAVTGNQSDPDTDLGAVFQAVSQMALPSCVTLAVQSATTHTIDVQFWAYFANGLVVPASVQQSTAEPVVQQWLGSLDIGGVTIDGVAPNRVFRDTLRDVIAKAFTTPPTLVVIVSPTDDIHLSQNEVPEPGTVTAAPA